MTEATMGEFVTTALKAGPLVAEAIGEGSSGGYLCCFDNTGRLTLHLLLGEPSREEMNSYYRFSAEKCLRLHDQPDHVLSWQSRSPQHGQYGGAIRLPTGAILSFSGLPELADEALCAALALRCEWISVDTLFRYLAISNNMENFESARTAF